MVLLLDEAGQKRVERRHRDHQDEGADPDPDPKPRHAGHVADAVADRLERAGVLLGLEGPRAREREEERRDDEGARVESEDGRRACEAVDRAGEARADEERALA